MTRGRVVVEHELTGPTALLLRWALTKYRQESGVSLARYERRLYHLVDELADAARTPPGDLPDLATNGQVSGTSGDDLLGMKEAAEATGIARRTLAWRCRTGHVPGAVLVAGRWLIPARSIKELHAHAV